jgi:hypothetical protein
MVVRNKRPCANCPPPKHDFVAPSAARPPGPTPTFQNGSVKIAMSVSEEEGLRLWKHVLYGTSSCIGMIEGYSLLDVPGNPLEALVQMRDRLNTLISKHEGKHAPKPATE